MPSEFIVHNGDILHANMFGVTQFAIQIEAIYPTMEQMDQNMFLSHPPVAYTSANLAVEFKDDWLNLGEAFVNAMNQASMTMQLEDDMRIFIRIEGETFAGETVIVYVPSRRWGDVTANWLLELLSAKLNSADSLVPRFRLFFVRAQNPAANVGIGARLKYRGDFREFMAKKKCVVQILPDEDEEGLMNSCVMQWVTLGIAHLVDRKIMSPEMELLCHELEWSEGVYKSLTTGGNRRFKIRKTLSGQVREYFQFQTGKVDDLKWLEHLEDLLHCWLVIFDFTSNLCPVYPPSNQLPRNASRPTIYGITCSSAECLIPHVDFVSKPCALIGNGRNTRLCEICLQFYNRSPSKCELDDCKNNVGSCFMCHTCAGMCVACHRFGCRPQAASTMLCDQCGMSCSSTTCHELHAVLCPKKFVPRCDICGRRKHYGIQCDEWKCTQCGQKLKLEDKAKHECFLRRRHLMPESDQICVYDFECLLDGKQRHIPYLATCWFPFGHPEMDKLLEKYPHENDVFVFWGVEDIQLERAEMDVYERDATRHWSGVYRFFDFLRDSALKGYDFFAHNGKGYDHILVKEVMMREYQLFSQDITRGRKFLQVFFPDLEITLKDSVCFIPSALRNLADDFQIEELRKGHFPHTLMTLDYYKAAKEEQFIVDFPPRSAFDTDFSANAMKYHIEAEKWLDELYANPPPKWDLKRDCIEYCISDTVLLGKVLMKFREETLHLTANIPRPADLPVKDHLPLDPLRYTTLPSAIMSFYLSQCLPTDTIAVIDRFNHLQSRAAMCWLKQQEVQYNIELQYEFPIYDQHRFVQRVDGYDAENRRVFQFLGCYWHGCPQCFKGTKTNKRVGRLFGDLYTRTVEQLKQLEDLGFEMIFQWECQWAGKNEQDEFDHLPLDPREAYRGGKSEVYKHLYDGEIEMVDFVSQYPTSMLGESYDPHSDGMLSWPMPTGQPQVYKHCTVDRLLSSDKLGVAKVRIEPPFQLYAPFLSMKVFSENTYEVLYGLCRTCMELRNDSDCTHTSEERSFTGTWTLSEIRYAVHSLGYRLHRVFDMWEYESQSTTLFRDFIVPFMVNKICSKASGLVDQGVFTEKGHQVASYLLEMTGRSFSPSDFQNNPARRTVSKLIQNAFTGKWGEKEDHATTATFYQKDFQKAWQLLYDSDLEILAIDVLNAEGNMMNVNYVQRAGATVGHLKKNDHIVAHITAYGRIMLSRLEQHLGNTLIYEDTDSAFHCRLENKPYKEGFRTGDLELELSDGRMWRCICRKSYAYLKGHENKPVCKQKGVPLKLSTIDQFDSKALRELIVDEKKEAIEVEQTLFTTEFDAEHVPYKKTVRRQKRIKFFRERTKRRVLWPDQLETATLIDSLPFGWRE